MAKKWAEVQASPAYQALAPEAKEQARRQYFDQVIAPQVPPEQLETVRSQFDTDTRAPVTMDDQVPTIGDPFYGLEGPRGSLDAAGAEDNDPVMQMWADALPTIAQGAPEALATMGNNALVMGGTGLAATLKHPLDANAAADYVNSTLESQLYQPQGAAKELLGGVAEGLNLEPAKEALGGATLEATGSPAAATGAHMLPDTLLATLGLRGGVPAAGAAESGPSPLVMAARDVVGKEPLPPVFKSDPVADLRAGGIKLRPSDIKAMHPEQKDLVPGTTREKFSNPHQLKEDFILDNQATLTKRAADELGVKDLTDQSLAGAEAPHLKTYQMAEEVASSKPLIPEFENTLREAIDAVKVELPRGEKPTVTRVLSTLRDKARRFMKADNQEANNQGYAAQNLADALEESFGKQLESVGEPQLLQQYRDARQSLGRIYDVWDNTKADQIDAHGLKRLNDKYGGKRLTDGLKFIADAAERAPNVTGSSLKTASRAGEEVPHSKEGIFSRGAKAIVRKIPGMDVGADAFQESLGMVDPARSSYYGQRPPNFVERLPQQAELDIPAVLGLEAPPGAVGRAPQRPAPETQEDAFSAAFDLESPEGSIGTSPSEPRARTRGLSDVVLGKNKFLDDRIVEPGPLVAEDLSEVFGLSEPLVKPRKKPKR